MDHENRFKERGLLLSVGDMSTTRNPLPDRGFSDLATDKGAPGWVCGAARLLGNLGRAGPLDPPGLAPPRGPFGRNHRRHPIAVECRRSTTGSTGRDLGRAYRFNVEPFTHRRVDGWRGPGSGCPTTARGD